MRVAVVGLWHLGVVTAACLASVGHQVIGLEDNTEALHALQQGRAPFFEPGLEDLLQRGLDGHGLSFTSDAVQAVSGAEVVWITYDTPVDDADQADVAFVVERVARLFPHLRAGTLVLISSQIPVGTTQRLEQVYAAVCPEKPVTFAYAPENLRLGRAIGAFTQPDRVVVGVRCGADRARLEALLRPFTERLEWMSVESAEMTKHAINAFLAMSVAFINELAGLCEQVGADAKDVERGLKSEARIGPQAYLAPGSAFAGGTLARDVNFLTHIGVGLDQPMHLLAAVRASNEAHKHWARRTLLALLGEVRGQAVAVWGLTYKPGTDILRRSSAVELCGWLAQQGARVQAHDPAVKSLPAGLACHVVLCPSALDAVVGASALVVATEWPEYGSVDAARVLAAMRSPVVVDANRFLVNTLGSDPRVRYAAVGRAR